MRTGCVVLMLLSPTAVAGPVTDFAPNDLLNPCEVSAAEEAFMWR